MNDASDPARRGAGDAGAPTAEPPPRREIVVGVDGSSSSEAALRWAVRAARTWRVDLRVVAAWEPANLYGWSGNGGYIPDPWNPRVDAEKAAGALLDAVCGPERPTGTRVDVLEGHPARVLLDASRGALALVVGSHGHGAFVGMLLGSVSAHCAEHASLPVVVVHGDVLPPLPEAVTA